MEFSSIAEQVARHLELELRRGRWSGRMPGRDRLAVELGVNRKTVERALRRLEERGVLAGGGAGRRRAIMRGKEQGPPKRAGLRVEILPYGREDRGLGYMIELQHLLLEAGHSARFAAATLLDLGRDLARVAALVEGTAADAWVIAGGPRGILEWFAAQAVPAFALFGRRRGLPLAGAGPDKIPVIAEVVRRLIGLGHRRIVLLARGERRKPRPGTLERKFLAELAAHGIATGDYHLPDWEETPEGFRHCLDQLFSLTPPTALILDEAFFLGVAQLHLARRGILTPEDVSLVCQDGDPSFAWYSPPVAHIRWDPDPVIRRIVRWVGNVARGKEDRRQMLSKAEFVEGGTIGPARM